MSDRITAPATATASPALTRRAAVAGALAAGALAAAPLAARAAEAASDADGGWDREVDVLVAGTGTAVHAAIACAEFGSPSVLVIDKNDSLFGGTSGMSGGGYSLALLNFGADEGISDTREDVLTYMRQVVDGRADADVQEAFVDACNEFAHFVVDTHGWSRWGHINQAFGDYYGSYAGALPDGFGRGSWYPFDAEGNQLMAPAQWPVYRAYLEGHDNTELVMGVEVTNLVAQDGAVVGAVLSDGTRVKARAVILGTGGFEHNEKMRKLCLPFPYLRSNGMVTNTGDAQRMGAKIGAELAYMDKTFGCPYFVADAEFDPEAFVATQQGSDAFSPRGLPHAIMVNRKGRRFCNESAMYDTMNRAFGTFDTGSLEYVNIPGFWIAGADYAATYLMPGYTTVDALPDYIFAFDTLEELAEGMGIDAEALVEEVAAYDANAAQGVDPVWHRGEQPVENNTLAMMGMYMQLPGTEPQTSVLGTVGAGPYYCMRYVPGMMGGTCGGLHIDAHAQVHNVDGAPIAGLYAVGNCSSGVAGYWAGGATLGSGSVMGYLAAKHIMGK